MGCYLEDYWATVGTRAGRFLWRGKPGRGDANRMTGGCLGLTVLFDDFSYFTNYWWN